MVPCLPVSHLQGSRQDFHSPADPHSPPHHSSGNRKRNFARTNARPAALRFGVNRVPRHFSKGWQLLQRQALWVAPTQGPPRHGTRPLLSLPVPFSLRAHPLFSPALALPAIFSLEEEMATHSSILAWRLPWTGEPGGLQSVGLQRVGHD